MGEKRASEGAVSGATINGIEAFAIIEAKRLALKPAFGSEEALDRAARARRLASGSIGDEGKGGASRSSGLPRFAYRAPAWSYEGT